MKYLAFRNLIGVSHTEAEAKEEAVGVQVREDVESIKLTN